MRIGYTEEQGAPPGAPALLRRDAHADVEADLATSSGIGPTVRRLVRQMAADGWLGSGGRPSTGAGQVGDGAVHLLRRVDARRRSRAMLTINTVGPTLMDFGTEEQKAEFCQDPGGEIHFCIGYTERTPARPGVAHHQGGA